MPLQILSRQLLKRRTTPISAQPPERALLWRHCRASRMLFCLTSACRIWTGRDNKKDPLVEQYADHSGSRARSEDFDKVSALDAGADDYLTKPFSVDELLARLRVALRRVRYDGDRLGEESSTYENGDMRIDYSAGCVYISDAEIHLTPIEYKLLCLLAKNTGKVLTHNYILKEVWGSPTASDVSSLRVYMATLRRKLEKNSNGVQYIQTHVGIGYRMLRITNK